MNLGSSSAAALATLSSSSQVSCHFNSRNAAFRKQLQSTVVPLQCWGRQQLLPRVEAPQRRQCFVANAVWVIHFLWIFFPKQLGFRQTFTLEHLWNFEFPSEMWEKWYRSHVQFVLNLLALQKVFITCCKGWLSLPLHVRFELNKTYINL